MSKNKDKKIIETEVTYKNEQQVNLGNVSDFTDNTIVSTDIYAPALSVTTTKISIDENGNKIEESNTVEVEEFNKTYSTRDYTSATLTLDNLRNIYKTSGNSVSAAYKSITDFIIENKDNPEVLNHEISNLLSEANGRYDSGKHHSVVGAKPADTLEKLLTTDNEVEGLVCTTIHEFVMQTLNDCGMKAVLVCGGTDGGNHATLLYQKPDGNFVWNNYGNSINISASNIKDAVSLVYKKSGQLDSCGYYTIINGKASYQEFALDKDATFGDKMDKRNYNDSTPFSDNTIAQNSSIKGRVEVSNLGNIKAGVDTVLAKQSDDKSSTLNVSAEYRTNNNSELFDNSKSIGISTNYTINKGNDEHSTFKNISGIVSYTNGTNETAIYNNDAVKNMANDIYNDVKASGHVVTEREISEQLSNFSEPAYNYDKGYLSTFVKGSYGQQNTIYNTPSTSIKSASQITLMGGATYNTKASSVFGDARLLGETGLKMENKTGAFTFENTINGGVAADLRLTSGEQKPALSPTVKLNVGSSVEYSPNSNLALQAEGSAYNVVSKPSKETGLNVGVKAFYKPNNSNISFFGGASTDVEKQKLTLGGFNQLTENNVKFNTVFGAQINNNTTISVGYTKTNDKLNITKNNNMFHVGFKTNL